MENRRKKALGAFFHLLYFRVVVVVDVAILLFVVVAAVFLVFLPLRAQATLKRSVCVRATNLIRVQQLLLNFC